MLYRWGGAYGWNASRGSSIEAGSGSARKIRGRLGKVHVTSVSASTSHFSCEALLACLLTLSGGF